MNTSEGIPLPMTHMIGAAGCMILLFAILVAVMTIDNMQRIRKEQRLQDEIEAKQTSTVHVPRKRSKAMIADIVILVSIVAITGFMLKIELSKVDVIPVEAHYGIRDIQTSSTDKTLYGDDDGDNPITFRDHAKIKRVGIAEIKNGRVTIKVQGNDNQFHELPQDPDAK